MPMEPTTKDQIRKLLEGSEDSFVSGETIASTLGISRNSVWKAVNSLREDGFEIESVTNRGYRLISAPDAFDANSIARLIRDPRIRVDFRENVSSTNIVAKQLADEGAPEGTLVVANAQSAGRGRQGRSFASPQDTGVYFTLILRPHFPLEDVSLITSYAAVCLAQTIDECIPNDAQIKWVNDVFVGKKKVSGILSEASFDAETQSIAYVVVGIGVNVIEPSGGFDDDGVAGALVTHVEHPNDLRSRIVAGTINRFMQDYERIPQMPHLDEYRKRSLLDGRRVRAYVGTEEFDALVLGIDDDFSLRVQLESGEVRNLMSGEVHIPSSQLT